MTVKRSIITAIFAVLLLASPLQVIIDSSLENVESVCLVLASSISMLLYVSCSAAMTTQPLSTFVILGFCVTSQLGALLVQTLAWTALKSSLYDPVDTFGTLAFYQAIAMTVHFSYRHFSSPKKTGIQLFRVLLNWAGLYRIPRSVDLWWIGCIGLASYVVYVNEALLQSPLGKFGMAFNFLAWAPFLIPFFISQVGKSYCNWKLNRIVLIVYAVVLVGLGLVLNTRGVMFFGVATIGLLYLLAGVRNNTKVTTRSIVTVGAFAAIAIIMSGPISDLVTAMAIARGLGRVPVAVKVERTYQVWQRPDLIAAYRASQAGRLLHKAYDDHYIENPILARFVLTKYYDNSLHFANRATTDDARSRLQDVTVKYLWAVLPAPVLSVLGVDVSKKDLNFSIGDYLPYLSGGGPLGGHTVGSMLGQGIVLFGPLFPFVFAAICLGLFGLMDLLTIKHQSGIATISALGMLQIFSYFISGLSYEGLHVVFYFFVRNFEQTVLIYVLVFAFARRVSGSNQHRALGVSNLPTWGSMNKSSASQ